MITSLDQLIRVEITDAMRENAIKTAAEYATKLNKSIRKGEGTVAGCLGEEIFHYTFPFLERVNTYDYDFINRSTGTTYEIKTKERTVPPKLSYDCSISDLTRKQEVDWYVFAQVLNDYSVGWLFGGIKAVCFFEEATFYRKGDRDERNNFTFHCDTRNITICDLNPFRIITKGGSNEHQVK